MEPVVSADTVDRAILDYLCRFSKDSTRALAATGVAGFRRVIDLSTTGGPTPRPLPADPQMPRGRDQIDAWNGAAWTVVDSVQGLLDSIELRITDAEIRWVVGWEPSAGINLLRKIARFDPARVARICQELLQQD